MKAAPISPVEFREKVSGHLAAALALIPDTVPHDVFDESVLPMMDELEMLDQFLFGLDRDERMMEDQEHARERKLAAKKFAPSLERTVERLDERIQKLAEIVGQDATIAKFVGSMNVDLVIQAFVRLLELVPEAAFAEDRVVPPSFPSFADTDVAAIVALIRARRALDGRPKTDLQGDSPTSWLDDVERIAGDPSRSVPGQEADR